VSTLHLLHLAETAASRAAEYLRGVSRPADPRRWSLKSARDFVTEVDRTAEELIGDYLLSAEPGRKGRRRRAEPDDRHGWAGMDR
jgi:fructose-1,6-bisphosphatase/inositol monophosphatase family enzyme